MSITVVVINESSAASDDEVRAMVPALQTQVNRDFLPTWGPSLTDADAGEAINVVFASRSEATEHWQLVILDDSDQAGALGYHDLTDAGNPIGKVFAKSDKEYGLSLSVTTSHELLEMIADPDINYLTANPRGETTIVEVCDPVEDDQLGYTIDGVLVSDFVLPAYFGLPSAGGPPYSFKNNLAGSSPALAPGGYTSLFLHGHWTQLNARLASGEFSHRSMTSRRARKLV